MTTEVEILQYLHYHLEIKRSKIGEALTVKVGERTLRDSRPQ